MNAAAIDRERRSSDTGWQQLPVHSLVPGEGPVIVRDIRYRNPYDFTRVHRHDYFEVFFFDRGGGSQLIDLVEWPVRDHSCYIVRPLQVHLLRRNANSSGRLVQFREEVVVSADLKDLMQRAASGENAAILFENDPRRSRSLRGTLDLLQKVADEGSGGSHQASLHLLHALLFQVFGHRKDAPPGPAAPDRELAFRFRKLLEDRYLRNRSVRYYAEQLGVSEKKLSAITKKFWGLKPIQAIHDRILLEAKRMLVFEDASHKEIAYHLRFDSPASFSQFIKNKTGLTPSSLQDRLAEIHK